MSDLNLVDSRSGSISLPADKLASSESRSTGFLGAGSVAGTGGPLEESGNNLAVRCGDPHVEVIGVVPNEINQKLREDGTEGDTVSGTSDTLGLGHATADLIITTDRDTDAKVVQEGSLVTTRPLPGNTGKVGEVWAVDRVETEELLFKLGHDGTLLELGDPGVGTEVIDTAFRSVGDKGLSSAADEADCWEIGILHANERDGHKTSGANLKTGTISEGGQTVALAQTELALWSTRISRLGIGQEKDHRKGEDEKLHVEMS